MSISALLIDQNRSVELKNKLEQAQKDSQFLKERRYYVKTNEFIERDAREKLNMVQPGEYVILLPPPSTQQKSIKKPDDSENWEKWLNLFK